MIRFCLLYQGDRRRYFFYTKGIEVCDIYYIKGIGVVTVYFTKGIGGGPFTKLRG
jgi:hypothetical protein